MIALCVSFTCCFFISESAEWPFGSSFQPPVSLALAPRADAIQRQPPTSSGKGLGAGGSWLWEVSGGAAGFAGLG